MNYDFSRIEPWSDSISGRPITKITFSQNIIVIELATQELLDNVRKWNDEYRKKEDD